MASDIVGCCIFYMIKNFKYIFFLQVKQMGIFKDCGCGCNGGKAREKFLISMMSAGSGLLDPTAAPNSVAFSCTPSCSC